MKHIGTWFRRAITNFYRLLIGLFLLIATPFIGWPGMEHRAAQMNFFQYGIVVFLASFLPASIGIFLIYSLTTLFFIPGINTTGLKMFQMVFLGTLFFYFVKENSKRDIDTWINIVAALFLVNITWVILQAFGHQYYFNLGPEHVNGPMVGLPGIMGQRVFQGILCAVAAPILLKKSFWFAPLILVGLYFSKSSVAVASALMGVLFLYPKKILFVLPFALIALFFIWNDINFDQFRMIYEQSFPLIQDHWFGQGIGSFHNALIAEHNAKLWWREAHNEYYQLYFEFGRIGVFLLLWLLLDVAVRFIRNRSDKVMSILGASFVAFLVACGGQPVMHVVRIAMVGVVITALIYARSDQLKGATP